MTDERDGSEDPGPISDVEVDPEVPADEDVIEISDAAGPDGVSSAAGSDGQAVRGDGPGSAGGAAQRTVVEPPD
ncbi:MAG TPA: hypothetical protein VGO26_01535 [Amnibacterium sp.]|jgi:hypothetical protein|nr:hypothetical protein [Amnibacterium sp.]